MDQETHPDRSAKVPKGWARVGQRRVGCALTAGQYGAPAYESSQSCKKKGAIAPTDEFVRSTVELRLRLQVVQVRLRMNRADNTGPHTIDQAPLDARTPTRYLLND